MNMRTYLQQLQFIVTGEGFVREKEVPLERVHLQSSGAPLTTTLSTNPGFDKDDTNITTLAWAAGKVVAAGLRIKMPTDYDESADTLSIWLYAKMSGSTDTTTAITAEVWKVSAGTTDLAPDQTADLTSSYAWVEFDLDGNSIDANEILQVALTPEAHGTDAIHVAAIAIRYQSDLVPYNHAERSVGATPE